MAKSKKEITDKVENKLKEFQFKSPQQAKDPKLVEKKVKEVLKEKPKKEESKKEIKKSNIDRKKIIKKVVSFLKK